MRTRCRHGDLAIIIKEEVGCESNLGRFVRVSGPKRLDAVQGVTWLIEPVTSHPFRYRKGGASGVVVVERGHDCRDLEHPDAWMIPVRPPKSRSKAAASRKLRAPEGASA